MRKFLRRPLAELVEIRTALARAEGLPRRSIVVGGVDRLPQIYLGPGTPGWTDELVPEAHVDELGNAALEIDPYAERHLGKRVQLAGGREVAIPSAAALVDEDALPASLRARLPVLATGRDN